MKTPNDKRATLAAKTLQFYTSLKKEGETEPALRDLLTDLMHWSDKHGKDFDDQLRIARSNYSSEVRPAPFPEGYEPGTRLQFKGQKAWAPGSSAKFFDDPEGNPARFVVLNEIGTITLTGEDDAARLDLVLPDGVRIPLFSGGTVKDCWAELPLKEVTKWHKDGSNFNPKDWFRVL